MLPTIVGSFPSSRRLLSKDKKIMKNPNASSNSKSKTITINRAKSILPDAYSEYLLSKSIMYPTTMKNTKITAAYTMRRTESLFALSFFFVKGAIKSPLGILVHIPAVTLKTKAYSSPTGIVMKGTKMRWYIMVRMIP